MLMIGTSSNFQLTQLPDDGREITGVWGPYPNALTPDLRMIEGGQVSAGSILNWLARDIFGLDDTGFLTLDFWMGNRTPYRDARMRGAMLGQSLSQDRATIFRACVTAVALGSANVIFDLERQGVAIDRLVLVGGIMRNPLWLRATVDAIGKPVGVATGDNLSLYGAAVSSAVGLGLYPSLTAAAGTLHAPVVLQLPDMDAHEHYRTMLGDYREAVELPRPILHRLSANRRAVE